jgi:CDP-diacylglycerol--glycerol-3-phosphate 3-phosphatidyltransferase
MEYEKLGVPLIILPYLLLGLLAIAELSDACDGYFARKFNQVTDLGKILDPMADSIYRLSIFFIFTLPPIQLPISIVLIFLYRDSLISTLRTICALQGFTLAARMSGKLKAAVQASAALLITFLLIPYSRAELSAENLRLYSMIILGLAAAYTLLSGVDYIYAHRGYIAKLLIINKKKSSTND